MRRAPAGVVLRVATLVLVVTAAAGTTVGTTAPTPDAGVTTDTPVDRLAPVPAQTNNTTQHEDPDNVSEDGDTGQVASWFAGQLADGLRGSTLQLSQREYELADRLVGDEYKDYLSRYVDVAGETDSNADDEAGSTFREVQEEQRSLVNRTRTYERTFREYQDAREANDTAKARKVGRDVQRLAGEVNRSAVAVQRATLTLENRTDVSLAETRARLDALRQEVLAERANVTADLFVGTRLEVSANRTTAAFDRPALITGRLEVTNDSVGPPARARLRVGGTTRPVELDDRGTFAVPWDVRALAAVGPRNLTVRYLPEPDTQYLGSEGEVELSVAQVESSVDISTGRQQVRFGESLRVEGSVSAAGEGVAGFPVVIVAGDRRLGNVTTDGDGSYVFSGAFPAAVVDGQRSISARVPLTGRAVAPGNASTQLAVEATDTDIAAEVVSERGTVRIQGGLATANGPVPGRVVRVDAPGMAPLVTRTDAEGRYAVGFARPNDGPTNVTARFSGEGTNLNGSVETVRLSAVNTSIGESENIDDRGTEAAQRSAVNTSTGESENIDGGSVEDAAAEQGDGLDLLLVGVGLLALVGLLGGVVFLRSRRRDDEGPVSHEGETAVREANESAGESAVKSLPEPDSVTRVEDWLTTGEYERASRGIYALVRASLADRAGVTDDGTHWEFYDAVTAAAVANGEDQKALRAVTEAYEQATFAPTAVEEGRARTALSAGKRLLDGRATDA